MIFIRSFSVIITLNKEEANLWLELKFEAHINSMITQLVELCSQLPENVFYEITDAVKSQDSSIDLFIYKMALTRLEYKSVSKNGSEINNEQI